MPKLLVQAVTIAGKMIEAGKWEVEFPAGLQQDQTISLNLPIKDPALIGYLGKQQSINCVVDKEGDGYVVSVACVIFRIRHMINTATRAVESMALATPADRLCEHVLMYLLAPGKCDPRFIRFVGGDQPVPPPT